MTFDEMITDLETRIGSSPEVDATKLGVWLNQGLRAFCMEHDFTWLELHKTASTVANQASYQVPSDFKRIVELRIDKTATSHNIYRYVGHEVRELPETSEKYYSVFGKNFTVNPTPTTTGSNNIDLWYIRKATNMSAGSDEPSDAGIANMPEEYHEAIILYAYAIYQGYDEEHDERRDLVGNPRNPIPGTYYYFVNMAKREDSKKKKGQRSRMMSKQEFTGYTEPNKLAKSTVLRV